MNRRSYALISQPPQLPVINSFDIQPRKCINKPNSNDNENDIETTSTRNDNPSIPQQQSFESLLDKRVDVLDEKKKRYQVRGLLLNNNIGYR